MRFRPFILTLLLVATVAPGLAQAPPNVHVVQPGETLFRISQEHGLTVDELKRLNNLDDNLIVVGQRLRLTRLVPIPPRPIIGSDGTLIPPSPAPAVIDEPDDVSPNSEEYANADIPTTEVETVPTTTTPTDTQRVHVVQAGETLFAIALRYNTTVENLRRLNGIEGDAIRIGQRLVVGGSATTPQYQPIQRGWNIERTTVPADQVHFVRPGETLFSISVRLGVPLDDLLAANDLTTAPLVPGQMLYLPEPIDLLSTRGAGEMPPADTTGLALVYPPGMEGRRMASGINYNPEMFIASHRTLPLRTVVLVSNPGSGRSVFVQIMDRGPVSQSYLIELSEAAASALQLDPNAARRVELRELP
ncbi:MAG: LysM peptidoglycan-binding domain-containing protein [Rubricoccaceae bacterium]|nr:LysM peptidoglycan-binding domain-containing protein [Rubricoccaceae bacterium]